MFILKYCQLLHYSKHWMLHKFPEINKSIVVLEINATLCLHEYCDTALRPCLSNVRKDLPKPYEVSVIKLMLFPWYIIIVHKLNFRITLNSVFHVSQKEKKKGKEHNLLADTTSENLLLCFCQISYIGKSSHASWNATKNWGLSRFASLHQRAPVA